jgi:two-component system, OmpR family, response regulator
MTHILIVDDEPRIREVVEYTLAREGFRTTSAETAARALEELERDRFDLIVLDVMLPDLDGLSLCRDLRARPGPAQKTPILFLSSRGEELDRVLGLEMGGDDYLAKPFGPRELVARVKAVLRRVKPDETHGVLSHAGVTLDRARHEARVRGELVELTATEFGVLIALFEQPGFVLSRAQLMRRAYAYDNLVTERTIDTHVRRIRSKFRSFDCDPIATVHGVGYKAAG